MNIECRNIRNLLLPLAERLAGRDEALDTAAAERVENHLERCADCRAEMEAIRRHLALLSELPPPEGPADFARRCANRARAADSVPKHSARRWLPAPAAVALIAAVFFAGWWMGRTGGIPTQTRFAQMVERQTQLTDRLETLLSVYDENGDAAGLAASWEAPLAMYRKSAAALGAAGERYGGDPVIERGLALAVAQNIAVLEALCEYLDGSERMDAREREAIKPFDFALIRIPKTESDSTSL